MIGTPGRDALFQHTLRPDRREKARHTRLGDLDKGLGLLHADRADRVLADAARAAQHRQEPARLGPCLVADRQREPDAGPEGRTFARGGARRGIGQFLGRGMLGAVEPQAGSGDGPRPVQGKNTVGEGRLVLGQLVRPGGIGKEPLLVAAADLFGTGRARPLGHDARILQKPLDQAGGFGRDDERRQPLAPRTARPARSVQQGLAVRRQLGMDDEFEVRQVDAAGGHVGGHADAGPAVAHRLKRMRPLGLAQFARQAHDGKAAVREARRQTVHRRPRVGEDQRVLRIVEAQDVDDGILGVGLRDLEHLIGDVGMLGAVGQRGDPHRVALVVLRQRRDHRRHGGREQERPAVCRRLAQHELEILAEPEIEHLVGFVQDHDAKAAHVERSAPDMVGQATGRAHDDMRAAFERAAFVAHVHAAHARRKARTRLRVKPAKFARDLERQFARGCDDQRKRCCGGAEGFCVAQKAGRDRKAEADGLSRACLCRHQKIGVAQRGVGDSRLHRSECFVAAFSKCGRQGLDHAQVRSE